MKEILKHISEALTGKIPAGAKRSDEWPATRNAFLKDNPTCAICGGKEKLNVHHIKPFHLFPALELLKENLLTLCEGAHAVNCHFMFGHLLNWKSFNEKVRADAFIWMNRILNRPQ